MYTYVNLLDKGKIRWRSNMLQGKIGIFFHWTYTSTNSVEVVHAADANLRKAVVCTWKMRFIWSKKRGKVRLYIMIDLVKMPIRIYHVLTLVYKKKELTCKRHLNCWLIVNYSLYFCGFMYEKTKQSIIANGKCN